MFALIAVGWLHLAGPRPLPAQEEAAPVMEGRVEKDGEGVTGVTVVLHRVSVDSAGEIDSVRVDATGRFRVRLPTVPDPGGRGEVYFASVRHKGILYFGPPVHRAIQLDSLYTIRVFDTAPAPDGGAKLPVGIRYVVIEPAEDGWEVTDLFQVANEGDRTLVSPTGGGPVWSYPLPAGIRDPTVGEGDLSLDASRISNGSLVVTGALPPGERQIVVRYRVAALDLTFPLPDPVAQMELLVLEPAPPLEVSGLEVAEPIPMSNGAMYRRFAGTNLSDASVTLVAGSPPRGIPVRALAVALALALTVGGLWAYLRSAPGPLVPDARAAGTTTPGASPPARSDRRALLMEVALIDEALNNPHLPGAEVGRLRHRRATLVRRIEDMG